MGLSQNQSTNGMTGVLPRLEDQNNNQQELSPLGHGATSPKKLVI